MACNVTHELHFAMAVSAPFLQSAGEGLQDS
jgi:hypothetical protein